jgi:hypothetical protein
MANSSCEWIRTRLALWVGDRYGDGQTSAADGGDLCPDDRQEIDRHLGSCVSCQQDRAALEHALQNLWDSADHLPIEPVERSLWPALEDRLANTDFNQPLRHSRFGRGAADQSGRAWAALDGERPLRRAWNRDTLREAFHGPKRRLRAGRWVPNPLVAASVAACFLVLVIAVPLLHQQRNDAQNAILVNAAPVVIRALPAIASDESMPETVASAGSDDAPTNELAEADAGHSPETPATTLDSIPKKTSSTRFGYDLEHGIPAIPDTREAKPVY